MISWPAEGITDEDGWTFELAIEGGNAKGGGGDKEVGDDDEVKSSFFVIAVSKEVRLFVEVLFPGEFT